MDKNHYWTVLKCIKPLNFRTILVLKNSNRNSAVSMKAKKALVKKSAFLKPPSDLLKSPMIPHGLAPRNLLTKQ